MKAVGINLPLGAYFGWISTPLRYLHVTALKISQLSSFLCLVPPRLLAPPVLIVTRK